MLSSNIDYLHAALELWTLALSADAVVAGRHGGQIEAAGQGGAAAGLGVVREPLTPGHAL